MRAILFVLPEYPSTAGIESVTATIVPRLAVDGWKCDYLAPFKGTKNASHEVHDATEVFYFPDDCRYDSVQNREHTLNLLNEKRYSCIIYQDSYSPMERVIVEAAKLTKTPIVVFEHSTPAFVEKKRALEPFYTKMGFLRRVFHPILLYKEKIRKRYLFDNCTKYVLLSSSFIDDFKRASGITDFQGKLDIIPNPLTLPAKFIRYNQKENRIIYVGRLVKEKNVALIIEIWQRLYKRLPEWELNIIGDGNEKQQLEARVKQLGLSRVTFEGFQNPEPYYDKAKVILLTSKFEGWGLTLTEAMGRGCIPAVLNTYSSLSDIIINGTDGIIMNSSNPEDWAEKISDLINAEGVVVEKMSENAHKKACKFDIDHIIPEWHKLIRNVVVQQ